VKRELGEGRAVRAKGARAFCSNVLGLCEGRASRYKSSNLAQCLIVAQTFNKPLMPCFCKALVSGSLFIKRKFKY